MERHHPVPPVQGPPDPDGDLRRMEPPYRRIVNTQVSWAAWFHRADEDNLEDQVDILALPPFSPRTGQDHIVKPTKEGEGTTLEREEEIIVEVVMEK